MHGERVLVVDHSPQRRDNLKQLLLEKRVEVFEASSSEEALDILVKEDVSLILTETELPSKSGYYLLQKAKEDDPELEVILITHNATSYNLLQAMRQGAYDFIVRPIDTGEILYSAMDRAFDHIRLRRQNTQLIEELEKNNYSLSRALKMMKALNESIERLTEAMSVEDFFMALLNSATRVLHAERGFIALFDRNSGTLGIKASHGIPAGLARQLSKGITSGLTSEIAKRGKPVHIPDGLPPRLAAIANAEEREELMPGPGLLAAPLRRRDRVVGLVILSGHQAGGAFEEQDLHFLIQLAHHAALGLEKLGLIHQLQRGKTV